MKDYGKMELWELFHFLNDTNCEAIDLHLANQINSIDDIFIHYWHFAHTHQPHTLPVTRDKINSILINAIENENLINLIDENVQYDWWKLETLEYWVNEKLRNKLLSLWIKEEKVNFSPRWLYKHIKKDNELYLSVLSRLIVTYKTHKSQEKINDIVEMFNNVNDNELNEACELLSKATPAITACILNREKVPEKYVVKGLKALSKLTKQRDIKVKIDFESLGHLGPKSRLDAMKHLVGIINKWNRNTSELPFKKVPTKDDIRKFLFPCSMKYNDEVTVLLERFDELSNPKPKKPAYPYLKWS